MPVPLLVSSKFLTLCFERLATHTTYPVSRGPSAKSCIVLRLELMPYHSSLPYLVISPRQVSQDKKVDERRAFDSVGATLEGGSDFQVGESTTAPGTLGSMAQTVPCSASVSAMLSGWIFPVGAQLEGNPRHRRCRQGCSRNPAYVNETGKHTDPS